MSSQTLRWSPRIFRLKELSRLLPYPPPPGLEQPEQSQEGHQAQQDQVEEEVGPGDAAPAEAEQHENAAGGAPQEFPLRPRF